MAEEDQASRPELDLIESLTADGLTIHTGSNDGLQTQHQVLTELYASVRGQKRISLHHMAPAQLKSYNSIVYAHTSPYGSTCAL